MPTKKKVYDTNLDSVFVCPDKQPHLWAYRGKRSKEYVCARCGVSILKPQLKEETD